MEILRSFTAKFDNPSHSHQSSIKAVEDRALRFEGKKKGVAEQAKQAQ